jgi:hypothetical protein
MVRSFGSAAEAISVIAPIVAAGANSMALEKAIGKKIVSFAHAFQGWRVKLIIAARRRRSSGIAFRWRVIGKE